MSLLRSTEDRRQSDESTLNSYHRRSDSHTPQSATATITTANANANDNANVNTPLNNVHTSVNMNHNRHHIRTPHSTKSSPGDVRNNTRHCRSGSFDLVDSSHSSSHRHHTSAPLISLYGTTTFGTGRGVAQDPVSVSSTAFRHFTNGNGGSDGCIHDGRDKEQQSLLIHIDAYGKRDLSSQTIHEGRGTGTTENQNKASSVSTFAYYFIYALLNFAMSVPSLYGYASVIFNHDIFQPHIATLSKLCIWSSAIHQFTFCIFSSLSFAKAEVQDAGLLFLSIMSNFIANSILTEEGVGADSINEESSVVEDILSTTIVTLSLATASLGLVLMFLGKFNCADAVSYLPLPVVGGYLAFIGYFCVLAGVGLCINENMMDENFVTDMELLFDPQKIILALPGLVSGLIMMVVARNATHDAVLPFTMVIIPCIFYVLLYVKGWSLEDAREGNWVGEVMPVASVTSLLELVNFDNVRWDLVFSGKVLTVWLGMVFVVSFSSCLDVAAISMEMGDPLSVNDELITVGMSNFLSGLTFGQTGSYIFSQTILTYRTGYHSRWVGFLGTLMFLSVVISDVNLLEIAPLYFLGSTLIFIGIDLLYEWLIEVWHKLIPSEYIVLMATYIAIQCLGINGGIFVGVIVAVVEYVVSTASRISTLRRRIRTSKAVWKLQHKKMLNELVYDSQNPKIVTLEIAESVFFGSSLLLLSRISDEIGISTTDKDMEEIAFASPRHFGRSPAFSTPSSTTSMTTLKKKRQMSNHNLFEAGEMMKEKYIRPQFVVLDLAHVPNVDATAARSCFLQLARMCKKNDIVLCASGANYQVEWILRSHDAAYSREEEPIVKSRMLNPVNHQSHGHLNGGIPSPAGKLILFESVHDALHHCESKLLYDFEHKLKPAMNIPTALIHHSSIDLRHQMKSNLSTIFANILGMETDHERHMLRAFDKGGPASAPEQELYDGDEIYSVDDEAESFYIVLLGNVEIHRGDTNEIDDSPRSLTDQGWKMAMEQGNGPGNVVSHLETGDIFGYVDYALGRRRSISAICVKDGTVIVELTRAWLDELEEQNEELHRIIEKILLRASVAELAKFENSIQSHHLA